jgi:hypothetical protein
MNIFGHVSVFISIVLGLAVVHLLSGLSLILDTRVRTKVYWLHLVWTANMMFTIILVWLSSFVLAPLEQISALHFLNLVAYAVVTYLMTGLLYPVRGEEVTDFREHFSINRQRFFALGILFVLVDAADGILEYNTTDVPLDVGQFGTLTVWLCVFAWGLRDDRESFNVLAALVYLVGLVGWMVSLVQTGVLAA